MKRLSYVAILALVVTGLAGCGGSDSAQSNSDTRTVEIVMKDIAFAPGAVAVRAGETVRFVFQNEGKLDHDAYIGSEDEQAKHGAEMKAGKGSGHGGGHGGGSDGITVEPGKSGEIKYTFDDPGTVLIGCHQSGHYAAGMLVKVTVT